MAKRRSTSRISWNSRQSRYRPAGPGAETSASSCILLRRAPQVSHAPRRRQGAGSRVDPPARSGDGRQRMDDEQSEPIDVPLDALSPTALRGLVEEFVNREGTDYGLRERTLDEKVRDVMRQLERHEAKIVFDPETRSATIVVVRRRSS